MNFVARNLTISGSLNIKINITGGKMKKTKAEIKSIANEISAQYGCFLNVTEVGKVLGISRETARKLVSNLPCAGISNTNKYYIYDILEFIYK